jgi:hypothetical protein
MGTSPGRLHPARGACRYPGPGVVVARRPGRCRGAPAREITMVRGGSAHHIAHERGFDCPEAEDFRAQYRQDARDTGLAATVFLCGAYQFLGDIASGLLDALPRVLTLSLAVDEPLRDVLTLLSRELANVEPGQQTVVSGVRGSAPAGRAAGRARRCQSPVDGTRARGDQRLVPGRIRASLPGRAWASPSAVPHGVADDSRPRRPPHGRTQPCAHRRRGRVRVRLTPSQPPSAGTTESRPEHGGNSTQRSLSRSTAPKTRRHEPNRTIAAERRIRRR